MLSIYRWKKVPKKFRQNFFAKGAYMHRIENLNGFVIYPLQSIKWITWITLWITLKVPHHYTSARAASNISIIQASVSTKKSAFK
jgi:hypothetical protein|tara:strand:- start:285 stop:539 length:255 start_codon:yes stop_codon:yes gene_type:complete